MRTNFDPLARLYRYLEFGMFGRALWNRRIAYLRQLRVSQRVLMAGEGDGRFLTTFLKANPHARVDYFDSSAKMLSLARQRSIADQDRVRYFQADFLEVTQLPATYDAIVTHFFLDCFSEAELERVIAVMARSATADAYWVVSEFRGRTAGSRLLIRGLYLFFGFTTGLRVREFPSYHPILCARGFRLIDAETSLGGLLTSELWSFRGDGAESETPKPVT
jgi:ubiquinone/menaquinone biosynthesis C-methylase UbiE